MKTITLSVVCLFVVTALGAVGQVTDSAYVYGIHWYGDPDATDVESMTGSKGIWVLEITHVDASQAPVWDQPAYFVSHCQKVAQAKGHSMIFRVQPYWSRNVPHSSDPYTLTNYADDCKAAANTLKDYVHIWQIGNEVNIKDENKRWSGTDYSVNWEPSPDQYAETYIACRDKIHEVTPTTSPATQVVLMQPVSPGNTDTWRYMDGNEFLWRQIQVVSDKSKIDGFALHGYAEPGGVNYGVDGFWDSIREQLMIIDALGLGDRPVYITEFNKHMPNSTEASIGAKFLHRAYTQMNNWNSGFGGEWPGFSNHNIIAATWFAYPDTSWTDYSLKYWKSGIASTDYNTNPWYSFQYACTLNYGKGSVGGGPASLPQGAEWWRDTFDGAVLDTSPPLPDWKAETTGAGSVVMSGTGSVRLLGNGSLNGGGGIRTAGYVYGDFNLETNITITNAARASTGNTEANFDLRFREGSKGYSVTFFTSESTNANRIILRRTNDWTQIGGYNVLVPGGINSGDSFKIDVNASGTDIGLKVYKNSGVTPVVNWSLMDYGQKVGWIRLMTYNLNEARIDDFTLGGPDILSVPCWLFY